MKVVPINGWQEVTWHKEHKGRKPFWTAPTLRWSGGGSPLSQRPWIHPWIFSPPSLLTRDQTQSISHSLLIVDTLSLRDLAAMATKSRQTFFFLISGSTSFSIPWGMIERSLHLLPCLTAHKLSFLKLQSVWCGRGICQLLNAWNYLKYPNHPQAFLYFPQQAKRVTVLPKWLQVSVHTWNLNLRPNIFAYLMAFSPPSGQRRISIIRLVLPITTNG